MDESGQLFVVSVDNEVAEPWGVPESLFSGAYLRPEPDNRSFDVAPDGRFVMIKPVITGDNQDAGEIPDIVVVRNWFEELKERVPIP